MNPIKTINGKGLPLMMDDIDTDRIIPGRFLRCVTFDGLGEHAFEDERIDANGNRTDFPMNSPAYKGASVIISMKNFGCGSSREHAPQSLKRAGINAIIAESFAEIFFGNSLTLGLACLTMSPSDIKKLAGQVANSPQNEVKISLETLKIEFDGIAYSFAIPENAREALLKGTYDLLVELLKNKQLADEKAKSLPY
jgi:3-isopropylmalate/(R)-2-methylmalate dehydratase small subunit